jgi:hypothetical protein
MGDSPVNLDIPLADDPGDGVYKVRSGVNGEKLIQVRPGTTGEYRRFTEDNGKKIIFVKV